MQRCLDINGFFLIVQTSIIINSKFSLLLETSGGRAQEGMSEQHKYKANGHTQDIQKLVISS